MRVGVLGKAAPSSPPVPSAMANRGPKGRGVKSGSQVPHRTARRRATSSQNERRRAVLPTPASPQTTSTEPRPPRPTEASASSSTLNGPARSTNRSDRPGTAPTTAARGMPNGAPGRAAFQLWPALPTRSRSARPRYFGTNAAQDSVRTFIRAVAARNSCDQSAGYGTLADEVPDAKGRRPGWRGQSAVAPSPASGAYDNPGSLVRVPRRSSRCSRRG